MNKRETENFIVIGTAHLGMDLKVLEVIKTAADYYKAQVIHVGPLATIQEIAMWNRRQNKIKTWLSAAEKRIDANTDQMNKKLSEIQSKISKTKEDASDLPRDKRSKHLEKIKKLKEEHSLVQKSRKDDWDEMFVNIENLVQESCELEDIQWQRIEAMRTVFGDDMLFVSNSEISIPSVSVETSEALGIKRGYIDVLEDEEDNGISLAEPLTLKDALGDCYVEGHYSLGKHLHVTSVPANGDRVYGSPITDKTFRMLREFGGSHIVPHMTPNVRVFPRPGLNQAYNFITTGAIQVCSQPKKSTDAYKSSARTSCILVSVDKQSGEFYPDRLRVKFFWNEKTHRSSASILHDGVLFGVDGSVINLKSDDKAMFASDLHAPFQHNGVIASIQTMNTLHEPEVYVDGGDTVDFESVSPHTRHKPKERENLRLANDLRSLYEILDNCANPKRFPWIKERVLLDSNHAEWVSKFVSENPTLEDLIDWKTIAKNIPDWDVKIRKGGEDNHFYFGDLVLRHGDVEGTVMGAYSTFGNYMAGHHHRYCEFIDAIFIGPGCRLGPSYLSGRVTSWQLQIASITKYRGQTCKHPKTILYTENGKDGKARFAYRGQVYETKYSV